MLPGFLKRMRQCASIVVFILISIEASAQNARFAGQVTDAQNAAIPKAAVEITNQDTGVQLQTVTDEQGNYSIPYLTAGHYRIVVQAQGFDLSAHDVELGMGQALIFNVQLTVAGNQTTVNVQAGNELTELHLETSELSGTITGKEVVGIQLNGRNFTQLMALAPGVSNQTQQDEARVGMAGSVSYSVNGGRTEYNSFQADGSELLNVGINKDHTSLIVTPSIDAIQEIKVLTSNYGAMYPSTGNGTTIVTTKSGGDRFHGSLYQFFRNEALNAKGYFDIGKSAPLYRRNDFGGTIGGPLSIPRIYDARGRTHFFVSVEARIEKDPYAYRQAAPSLEERNGDFSDVCPPLANGEITTFSRTKYPDCPSPYGNFTFINNQISYPTPQDGLGPFLINQNATAILNTGIIPLPNATTGCNSTGNSCYLADVSLPTYWRQELFRIDHAVNSKVQAGFRYIHDEWDETTPVPQYAYIQNSFPTIQNRFYAPGRSLVARLTAAFSPSFLNEFVASYTDSFITLRNIAGPGASLERPAELDAPCSATDAQCAMTMIFNNGAKGIDGVPKIPGISIAGNNGEYGGFGFAADTAYMPWEHTNPVYSFSDNLNKFVGRHNLQFGVQWIFFQRNQTNGPIGAATGDTQGLLTFSNIGTNAGTGNAFANFLYTQQQAPSSGGPFTNSGYISSFEQDSGQAHYRQRYQIVEPYFQDDFKVTSHLTLNLGLRLSLFGNYREANNQAYNWETSAFSMSAAQTVQVGQYGNLVEASNNQVPLLIN